MTYREKELANYLEDCRNREVTPRLHYVKHLKTLIKKEEKKQEELFEFCCMYDSLGFWKRLKEE